MSARTAGVSDGSQSFNARIIVGLVVAGIVGFIGYWLISALAPAIDAEGNGGNHALSRSAVGFSGLYALAQEAGLRPQLLRDTQGNGALSGTANASLLILTPPSGTDPEDIVKRIGDFDGPVLVVLPKYNPLRDPARRGWVRNGGAALGAASVLPFEHWRIARRPQLAQPASMPSGAVDIDIYDQHVTTAPAPERMQLFQSEGLYAVAPIGDALLIAGPDDEAFENIHILADPDFLNNRALRTAEGATSAIAILRALAADGGRVSFDVTLNGLGSGDRTLLKLAVTPPFLGLTLCLTVAALLALWQGFVRFGPPWREGRAVALGKAALVANGAQLIVQARRLANFAPRYSAMIRDVAARRLHAPSGLNGSALDRWLDRFADRESQRFSTLAGALDAATAPDEIVRRAAALGQWRREVVRDGE